MSDQICIDFSTENCQKLPVAAAKAYCKAPSAITEWGNIASYTILWERLWMGQYCKLYYLVKEVMNGAILQTILSSERGYEWGNLASYTI